MAIRLPLLGVLALLGVALVGCVGWSAEGRASYLASIPVTNPDLASIADGTYNGTYTLKLPPGGIAAYKSLSVDVSVQGGAMISIAILNPTALASGSFYDTIVAGEGGVIARQSLDVDAVTGASYSSKAFLKAVEDALTL